MNLLHANDKTGQYPASYYAATATPLAEFAPLKGEVRADVCIVGGGYTGLSAALHLAQKGRRVVLLEAHRVGFGASGRNGMQQVHTFSSRCSRSHGEITCKNSLYSLRFTDS